MIRLNEYNNYRANTYNRFFEAINNNDFIEALNCVNYLIVEKYSIEWEIYKELLDVIVTNTVSKSDFLDRLDENEEELEEIDMEEAIYIVLKNLINNIRLVIDRCLDYSYFDDSDKDYNEKNINDSFYYMLCDGYYITANKIADSINNIDFNVSKRVMYIIKELLNIFEISVKRNEINKSSNKKSSEVTLETTDNYSDLLSNDEYSKLFDLLLKDENITDSEILAISAYLKSEEKTLSLKND